MGLKHVCKKRILGVSSISAPTNLWANGHFRTNRKIFLNFQVDDRYHLMTATNGFIGPFSVTDHDDFKKCILIYSPPKRNRRQIFFDPRSILGLSQVRV